MVDQYEDQTLNTLCTLIVENLEISRESLTPQSCLQQDHALDSHDAILLLLSIEETFDIKILDVEFPALIQGNLGDLAAFIEKQRAQ